MAHLKTLVLVSLFTLASFQTAQAVPFLEIDLGPAGSTIDPGTPVPFLLPYDVPEAHFVFTTDGVPMGHIQLLEPTRIYLVTDYDPLIEAEYYFHLTDMFHNPLPETHRQGYVGDMRDIVTLGGTDPIGPGDVEPGGFFHDIHFQFELLTQTTVPINAALVFDQPVLTGTWVPEPTSYAAIASLGLVGVGLGAYRRRKRAKV